MEQKTTRISKKKLDSFIDRVSRLEHSSRIDYPVRVSKIDGSFMDLAENTDRFKFWLKKGITEELQSSFEGKQTTNIGFNPEEQKWYGWSHRAIYGFGIGSTCKKGDCGYLAKDKEDFKDECLRFWGDDDYSIGDDKAYFGKGEGYDGKIVEGVYVTYNFNDKVPNEKLRGTKYEHFAPFPKEWGKGEWTATTLEEAKQMAIDFAESVS